MVFLRFDAAGFSVDRTAPRDPSSPRRGSHPGLRSMSLSEREAVVSAAGMAATTEISGDSAHQCN